MDTIETVLGLLAVTLLTLGTGFFVAVEFALVAVDRNRVQLDAAAGGRGAKVTAGALRRLSFYLSGAQLGITITSLVVGFIAEPTVAAALEPLLGGIVGDDRARAVSIVLALVIATVGQMVVGELVPKTLAIARPQTTSYLLTGPMVVVCRILGPVISLFNGAANWTVRRLGIEPQEELASVRSLEELELLIRSSGDKGTLEPEALTLLTRTIRFGEKDAAAALTPRPDVITLQVDDTVATLAERSIATGKSRFPVVRMDVDDVAGVVHVKDVYGVPFEARADTPLSQIMVPAFVVPETRDLADLLADLRAGGHHLALVVDEHGGTAGIITLEDVLEEIVGEIDDEHDQRRPALTRVQRPGEWLLDASLHHDEVFDACGFDMPDGDYDTLAGFVLAELGHIPEPGETFEHEAWQVRIESLDGLRVATVTLRRAERRGEHDR